MGGSGGAALHTAGHGFCALGRGTLPCRFVDAMQRARKLLNGTLATERRAADRTGVADWEGQGRRSTEFWCGRHLEHAISRHSRLGLRFGNGRVVRLARECYPAAESDLYVVLQDRIHGTHHEPRMASRDDRRVTHAEEQWTAMKQKHPRSGQYCESPVRGCWSRS